MRLARPEDVQALLDVFDARVAWLRDRRLSGQWGTTPFSHLAAFGEQLADWIAARATWVATGASGIAGTVTIADPPSYVPAAIGPELYLHALATRPNPPSPGVGAALVRHVEAVAVARNIPQIRLDCWAGGSGTLVAYYRGLGYQPVGSVAVEGWPGRTEVEGGERWAGVVLAKGLVLA